MHGIWQRQIALPIAVGQYESLREKASQRWLEPKSNGRLGLEDAHSANLS